MSVFWSAWIMFLVVFNLGVTLFLFLWGPRVAIPTEADGTSGHAWAHGVLREGVRKLPLWWLLLSGAMFIAGFTYLALYPGFGSYRGLLGWTAHGELARDTAQNQARLAPVLKRLAAGTVEDLSADPDARRLGRRLFVDNCAACHGREGRGNTLLGAPDLVDGDWLYGGDGRSVLASILDGRHGTMPSFSGSFDAASIENLASYVLSLSGSPHSPTKAAAGKALFSVCAACHGPAGTGNPVLGAPDLTDRIWLYGGDLATIEETIRNGRGGTMPAWRSRLDESDARLIASWIHAQSQSASAR